MKIKKILNYITLFVVFTLIFGFVLACGGSEPTEEVSKVAEEEEVAIQTEGPPTSDVAGEDISDMPRYPGSVRTDSSVVVEAGLTMIGYVTSSSVDEVVNFYEKELPANGWEILYKFPIEGDSWLTASKGDNVVKVICGSDDEYPGYTGIGVILEITE